MSEKVGRNDPCTCGSGKKYKACCLKNQQPSYSLGKRKFTAKVIGKGDETEGKETSPYPGGITPPDYTSLMERSFGPTDQGEKPPEPDEEFLPKEEK